MSEEEILWAEVVKAGIIGKSIKEAFIDGYDMVLKFSDGTTFEYHASDGGYSTFELKGE